jgi:hypothetical protein
MSEKLLKLNFDNMKYCIHKCDPSNKQTNLEIFKNCFKICQTNQYSKNEFLMNGLEYVLNPGKTNPSTTTINKSGEEKTYSPRIADFHYKTKTEEMFYDVNNRVGSLFGRNK